MWGLVGLIGGAILAARLMFVLIQDVILVGTQRPLYGDVVSMLLFGNLEDQIEDSMSNEANQ